MRSGDVLRGKLWFTLAWGVCLSAHGASAPTPEQALALNPIQRDVEYARPSAEDVKACTIKPEKDGKVTAWVVRDGRGLTLRRFADTNADNVVDQWSYFADGLEVYRDIDSNYDAKADQYRWFHSGGSRWGVDKNQNGQIDEWRRISPYEVAEAAVRAIAEKDAAAFERLLVTEAEIDRLDLPATLSRRFQQWRREAPSGFREMAGKQDVVTRGTRFVDFGAGRPGLAPSASGRDANDVLLYEHASALIETQGKPEQVQLGVMVQAGDCWRLVTAPQVGGDGVELSPLFALNAAQTPGASATPPTEKMQQLMAELEKLDARMVKATGADRARMIDERDRLLRGLADASVDPAMVNQWYTQLADMYAASVMEGSLKAGAKRLADLEAELIKGRADRDLLAHVRFQRIYSDWGLKSQDSKQDYAKVQEQWLKDLTAFVKAYPGSSDAAEAMLQLGMADEFAGRTEEAEAWYGRLAEEFSDTQRGRKGAGALRRLDSPGKPLRLAGPMLDGGKGAIDDYRGKHVLVQYWATWCEPCKSDMAQIKALLAKHGGRGFAVLGVNLDSSAEDARGFLKENPLPWKHLYDEGGLDGPLACDVGVMTLPLMMLYDDEGRVVNRSIHVAELDNELRRVLRVETADRSR